MRKSKKRAARCDVALLVDIETGERGPSGKFVVDCGSVEELLYGCLRTLYESAVIVPFDPKLTPTIAELRALKPRVVFNITEWVDGERRLDAAITAVLALLRLPYTGLTADAAHDPSGSRSFQKGGGRRLEHKVCFAQCAGTFTHAPGAPAWSGEITGGLNFLSLQRALDRRQTSPDLVDTLG